MYIETKYDEFYAFAKHLVGGSQRNESSMTLLELLYLLEGKISSVIFENLLVLAKATFGIQVLAN